MPNKLCCPVCKLSDLSYQPNYDQYLFSYTRFFNFLSFGEREREREGEREDVPSKESVIPLTPDSARLEGPFRK